MSDPACSDAGMKQTPRTPRQKPQSQTLDVNDFEQFSEGQQELRVEHQTIPGYLHRIPHKWNLDEITRFGREMGKAAEALQISYLTRNDSSLGMIRIFPLPLLRRVYTVMGSQFGWPPEAVALEDGNRSLRDELRRNEGTKKHLELAAEHAPNPIVGEALATVLDWLESEAKRLRGDEPLRTV